MSKILMHADNSEINCKVVSHSPHLQNSSPSYEEHPVQSLALDRNTRQ